MSVFLYAPGNEIYESYVMLYCWVYARVYWLSQVGQWKVEHISFLFVKVLERPKQNQWRKGDGSDER